MTEFPTDAVVAAITREIKEHPDQVVAALLVYSAGSPLSGVDLVLVGNLARSAVVAEYGDDMLPEFAWDPILFAGSGYGHPPDLLTRAGVDELPGGRAALATDGLPVLLDVARNVNAAGVLNTTDDFLAVPVDTGGEFLWDNLDAVVPQATVDALIHNGLYQT